MKSIQQWSQNYQNWEWLLNSRILTTYKEWSNRGWFVLLFTRVYRLQADVASYSSVIHASNSGNISQVAAWPGLWINFVIEHHPNIGDILSNIYLFQWCSKSPEWDIYQRLYGSQRTIRIGCFGVLRHVPKPAIWHVQKRLSCKGIGSSSSAKVICAEQNRAIVVLGLDWADGAGWRSVLRQFDFRSQKGLKHFH